MTFQNDGATGTPAILTPDAQQAVWFLGTLVRVRASGEATAGSLDILEHQGERGYGSPLHRHLADEETFFVIDGELRVEVGGEAHAAGPGAVAFLPRQLPHAFVVTSTQAHLTDDQLDTSTSGSIDELRMADLDDVGLPGYSAVVAIAADGEERLVLACRDGINTPAAYWPDWRKTARTN